MHQDQTALIHRGFERELVNISALNDMIPMTTANAGSNKIHKSTSRTLKTAMSKNCLEFMDDPAGDLATWNLVLAKS